jgi:hypothetical protein
MFTSETQDMISVTELKRLLVDLKERRPDISVRFRLLGEMWFPNFSKITLVPDKGVVLADAATEKLTAIQDLMSVMQFEIDAPFQSFLPFNHYDVKAIYEH